MSAAGFTLATPTARQPTAVRERPNQQERWDAGVKARKGISNTLTSLDASPPETKRAPASRPGQCCDGWPWYHRGTDRVVRCVEWRERGGHRDGGGFAGQRIFAVRILGRADGEPPSGSHEHVRDSLTRVRFDLDIRSLLPRSVNVLREAKLVVPRVRIPTRATVSVTASVIALL